MTKIRLSISVDIKTAEKILEFSRYNNNYRNKSHFIENAIIEKIRKCEGNTDD
jgi:hypothetical protein